MIGCHCHGVEHILSSRVSVLEQILCLALFSIFFKKKKKKHFLFSYVSCSCAGYTTVKTVIDCWPDFPLV